jgi:hypothetical protein
MIRGREINLLILKLPILSHHLSSITLTKHHTLILQQNIRPFPTLPFAFITPPLQNAADILPTKLHANRTGGEKHRLPLQNPSLLITRQRKTPLHTPRTIPPPIRHQESLHAPQKQKDQELIQIIPRVERRAQDIVVPRPQLVFLPIRPIHDYEAADDGGEVAGADVAVEGAKAAEEDGGVPEVELRFGKAAGEEVERGGCEGAEEEAVGEGLVDLLAEELCWALKKASGWILKRERGGQLTTSTYWIPAVSDPARYCPVH